MDSLKKYSDLTWQDLPHIESPSNAAFFVKSQSTFMTGMDIPNMRKIIQEITHSLMPPRMNNFEVNQLTKAVENFDVILLRFKPQQPVFSIDSKTNALSLHENYRHVEHFGGFTQHKIDALISKPWQFFGYQPDVNIGKNISYSKVEKTKETNNDIDRKVYPNKIKEKEFLKKVNSLKKEALKKINSRIGAIDNDWENEKAYASHWYGEKVMDDSYGYKEFFRKTLVSIKKSLNATPG